MSKLPDVWFWADCGELAGWSKLEQQAKSYCDARPDIRTAHRYVPAADVDVLREQLADILKVEKQMRCLRDCIERVLEWDCLSPEPRTDLLHDLAWLKRLLIEALEKAGQRPLKP